MKKVFLLVLFVCIALSGCALAAVPSGNQTIAASATTAPQLIGGDMGTYLVTSNVDGANVTFDSDYKGVITDGQLLVSVYTTGTPYPGKNETVNIPVDLVPLAAPNTTAVQENPTVPAGATTEMTTAAPVSPAPTTAGSLPFAAFGAFVVLGIFAIRSRR